MTLWPFAIILSPVAVLATVWALIQWRRSMDQFALAGRGVAYWSEAI